MVDFSEVADGIYQIETARAIGISRCSTVYFIAGEQPILVESGPFVAIPFVIDAIQQLGYNPSQLSYIILTHIHLDHAGGAGTLTQQFPNVQVLVHPEGVRHLIEPSRLIAGTRQAYGKRFEDDYGPILPVPERQVRAAADGEVVRLGDKKLKIIYTPSHATHHMCIYDESKSQGLFSGDSLSHSLSSITTPTNGFDLDTTLESLDRLSQLEAKIIFAPRGAVNCDVTGLVRSIQDNLKAYNEIILEAVRAGETKEEIGKKLEAYQMEHAPEQYRPGEHNFNNVISRYLAYFRKRGDL
ncbi:MAG: MBL fold metallo-hydrolase [Dehalococcoidales bacterium]|nr:MBL fold metallo-hydrolase [Dehalococcoidales bacterium]